MIRVFFQFKFLKLLFESRLGPSSERLSDTVENLTLSVLNTFNWCFVLSVFMCFFLFYLFFI